MNILKFKKDASGKYPNIIKFFSNLICIQGIFLDPSKYYRVSFTIKVPRYVTDLTFEQEIVGKWTISKYSVYEADNRLYTTSTVRQAYLLVVGYLETKWYIYDMISETMAFRKELISSFSCIKPIKYSPRTSTSVTRLHSAFSQKLCDLDPPF